MADDLCVLMHGEPVANLRRTRSNRLGLSYLRSDLGPVSLSLPCRSKAHTGDVVANWIDNLIPDDDRIRAAWARDNSSTSISPFDLLGTRIGEDCAGAVQFCVEQRLPGLMEQDGTLEHVDDEWIGERLEALRHAADNIQAVDHSRQMYSIGGLQPKLGLHRTLQGSWARAHGSAPTTHILKPAPRTQWRHLDINEHICMQAARSLGVVTADTRYERIGGSPAVIVERFDRTFANGSWRRMHAEDLCQAFGLRPSQKTEEQGGPSLRDIAGMLRRHAASPDDGEASVRRFGQALVLNWVIVGTDAHAKNYTLMHERSGATLAPLYDVSSSLPYLRNVNEIAELEAVLLAMRIGDDYSIGSAANRSGWRSASKELRIDQDFLTYEADRVSASFAKAAEEEALKLVESESLSDGDAAFCDSFLARVNEWSRHVRRMPVIAARSAVQPSPAATATSRQPASDPQRLIRCGQRLLNGEECNRRLRMVACPLHPSSPGSRKVRAAQKR